MNATIITIGDELLIGQVIDTNSAWIARELNKAGIAIKRRIAVGDSRNDILEALNSVNDSEIVLITGGLGPTADDITKPVLCEYFGGKLMVNDEVLQHVKYLFTEVLKRPLIDRNLKQAEVPDVCTVLPNKRGTAPGMMFTKNDIIYISMPGVPFEMKGIMTDEVLPVIYGKFKLKPLLHRTCITFGIGESFLAEMLQEFENALPDHVKLAYLPNFGMLRLRLTSNRNEEELDKRFSELKKIISSHLISDRDETMQELIGRLLTDKKKTVTTAESCTGGYVAHLLTSIPGSSAYFEGSTVSYSYNIKEKVLHVDHAVLKSSGAVSEEVVKQMASGALRLMETDYAIAISGIMGPGGGTEEKPVGTVWIAVADKHSCKTERFKFRYDRNTNIEVTSMNALNMLRQLIQNTN